MAAFSFYPSKNLGALGDGGAVCTGDALIAEGVRRLRNLGQKRKGEHSELGRNERLDGLQAAFLRVKLRRLDEKNAARRAWAGVYRAGLPQPVARLWEDPRGECVYYLFPIRVPNRNAVIAGLKRHGVEARIHYVPALHRQPALAGYRVPSDGCGAAEEWSEEEVSLPMFAELNAEEVSTGLRGRGHGHGGAGVIRSGNGHRAGDRPLQFAVVGLGYWGPNLLRVLVELPEVEVGLDLRPRR